MIGVARGTVSEAATSALSILYIGPDAGTCRARFEALRRIGHDALLVDPFEALPDSRWSGIWSFKTGGLGCSALVRRHLQGIVGDRRFDVAYVDSGELIDDTGVRALRRHAPVVVNYNPDNPYTRRDGARWRSFLRAVPHYDRLFVPRFTNVAEALAVGARHVDRVWFAADDQLKDVAHLPDDAAKAPFLSPLSFVGTWMPERGSVLAALIAQGLPLRIYGPRWDRAPEWAVLAPHTVLGGLDTQSYDAAVAAADVSIALLSKGNRDLHTTRSLEIPTLGSLLCGERTTEHDHLYRDGVEAVFWSSVDECVALCRALLADPARRKAIAQAGRRRAIANDHFNEPLMRHMIRCALVDGHSEAASDGRNT